MRVTKGRLILAGGLALLVGQSLSTAKPVAAADRPGLGTNGACVKEWTPVTISDVRGIASGDVSFRLVIPQSTPATSVVGQWMDSHGNILPARWWTGSRTQDQTYFAWWQDTYGGGVHMRFQLGPGAVGSIKYVVRLSASYGACFKLDQVTYRTTNIVQGATPPPGGGGGGGIVPPSSTPTPSAPPSRPPSLPPDEPWFGWCWTEATPELPSFPFPCATPSPPPSSPPATDPCKLPITFAYVGANGSTNFQTSPALDFASCPSYLSKSIRLVGTLTHTHVYGGYGGNFYIKVGSVTTHVQGTLDSPGGGGSHGQAIDSRSYYSPTEPRNVGSYASTSLLYLTLKENWDAPMSFTGHVQLYTPGTDPDATPSPSPTATPGGSQAPPSGFPQPSNLLPPLDAEPSSGTICQPAGMASLMVCQPVPSHGTADPSGAADAFGDLLSHAAGKAPFGYINQVGDALNDAITGASAGEEDFCLTIPQWYGEVGTQDVETCLPLQDFANQAAVVRPILLIMLVLLVGVGTFRWVRSTAPGG